MSHHRLTCPGTDAKGYLVHIWDIGSFDACSWSSLQEKSDLKLTHCFCVSYFILHIALVIHLISFHFYAFLLNRILTSDKANRWNAAAACCASFNTAEVVERRAVNDTVAHFSHMFNKTTFDLMFYEGQEEDHDFNKCCICCSWSGKHKLSLLCSAAETAAPILFAMFSQSCTFACFVLFAPWAAACVEAVEARASWTKSAVTSCVSWSTQLYRSFSSLLTFLHALHTQWIFSHFLCFKVKVPH